MRSRALTPRPGALAAAGLAAALALPATARGEDPGPAPAPTAPAAAAYGADLPAGLTLEAPAPAAPGPALLAGEVIEVWGERPDKPFDRDTELRLTGEELLHRGATNLAEALELLPDLHVRESGRGGRQVDIRGARKGSIKVLIDGVAVDDPFYGNFDISSIPVTDIVQVRVSTSPSSPIDGPGGPGGVIEVHTRDAAGSRHIATHARGSSLPDGMVAATGRSMLTERLALRMSATAELGSQDFALRMNDQTMTLDEDRRQVVGAMRLEHRDGDRRVAADAWVQRRSYVVPPGEDFLSDVLVIDGETSARAAVSAEDRRGAWQLSGRAYAHALARDSIAYTDATMAEQARAEDLRAGRAGAGFLATRPLGKTLRAVASTSLDVEGADVDGFDGRPTSGMSSIGQLAAGVQYERYPFRADAAVGLAVPVGVGAAPWPEAKLSGRWRPARPVELSVTLGRKGRLPTLRERFRTDIGNAALGPEQAYFGEIGVTLRPVDRVTASVASYWRQTDGMIRFGGAAGSLVNLGALSIRGVDARLSVVARPGLTLGADGSFTDAYSPERGTRPLDFLPLYRAGVFATAGGARMGGTVAVRAIGERLDQAEVLGAYRLVDVSAYARLGGGLLAQARVANAADEAYLLRRGGVQGTGRVVTLSVQGTWE